MELMKPTTSQLHSSAPTKLNLKTIIQSSLRSEGETRQEGTSLRKRGEQGCWLNLDLYFLGPHSLGPANRSRLDPCSSLNPPLPWQPLVYLARR